MITEQTGQLVYDYDVQNNSNYWVGAIEELTGYSFEEFQGFTPRYGLNTSILKTGKKR